MNNDLIRLFSEQGIGLCFFFIAITVINVVGFS